MAPIETPSPAHERAPFTRRLTLGLLMSLVSATLITSTSSPAFAADGSADLRAIALDLGRVFTFFFLTIGPKQVLVPFAQATEQMGGRDRVHLALRTSILSLFSILLAATLGVQVLSNWGISPGALLLTAGIILFLVALNSIRDQYEGERGDKDSASFPAGTRLLFRLTFPYIVSPYGVAVVILTMSLRPPEADIWPILAMLAALMALNFLVMVLAGRILATGFIAPLLAIVGSVLAVLQAALGVQMILVGLRLAGAMPS